VCILPDSAQCVLMRNIHAHTHKNTRTHVRAHIDSHARTHIHQIDSVQHPLLSHKDMPHLLSAHTHTHTHTHIHTHKHTQNVCHICYYINNHVAYTHTCVRSIYTRKYVTRTRIHIHVCYATLIRRISSPNACTRTNTHTHTHTHTQLHPHTCVCVCARDSVCSRT